MKARSFRKGMAVLLTASVAVTAVGCGSSGSEISIDDYTEEQVIIRDIGNYSSYEGTIVADTEKNVYAGLNDIEVVDVLVEEGDEVSEGDVLVILDEDSVQDEIDQLQATMDASATSSALSIESAQKAYDDYLNNLNDGLDSSMQNAINSIDSAYASLVTAQQNFNNEVSLNNQELSSTVMSAQQSVESAYNSLLSAYLSLTQAEENREDAEENDLDDTQMTAYDQQVESAELQVSSAQTSYDNAVQNYQAAIINEDNNLTQLYNSLIQAQESYLAAIDSYNASVRSATQQLESYALQIEIAEANADQTTSEYQMESLLEDLEDCNITAPIDGVITEINVTPGDTTSATDVVAVVTNFDVMKIDVSVDEYDIQEVEEGSNVTILVDAIDQEYEGTVATISRTATVSGGVSYFDAEISFEPDESARSGMSAEVQVTNSEALDATSVSSEAIQTAADGTTFVYMYADDSQDSLVEQPVTVGISDGSYTEITDGLYPGDTILYIAGAGEDEEEEDSLLDSVGGGNAGGGGGMSGGGGGGGAPAGGGGGGGAP